LRQAAVRKGTLQPKPLSASDSSFTRGRSVSVLQPLEIKVNEWAVGKHSGQLPPILTELIQLLLTGRLLFRQIAREQLVLPDSLVADVNHRRDRRGGLAEEIGSVGH
jgi:hypothetical protein